MHNKAGQAKSYAEQHKQYGYKEKHIDGYWNGKKHHHNRNNAKRDHHLKSIDPHQSKNENILWQIYPGDNVLISFDNLYAVIDTYSEKIPDRKSDENKNREKRFFRIKNVSENEKIQKHKAQRVQYPPQPIQI